MDSLLRDLKFSARSLLKHKAFTVVAVLTLAIGIGANTTIFSTVDALILHPFSFPNQDRLLVVYEQNRAVGIQRGSVASGNFVDWRDQNQTCEQLIAIQQKSFDLSDGAHPERFPGYGVTSGFFDALGVKAARGRTLLPEDSEPGREQVVVLKHSFWQQHFAGDPGIVGKSISLNRKQFTIVGVMPADFNYPYNSGEMWAPLIFSAEDQKDRGDLRPLESAHLSAGGALGLLISIWSIAALARGIQPKDPGNRSAHGVGSSGPRRLEPGY
jgi:putative ABC transport system permease protein